MGMGMDMAYRDGLCRSLPIWKLFLNGVANALSLYRQLGERLRLCKQGRSRSTHAVYTRAFGVLPNNVDTTVSVQKSQQQVPKTATILKYRGRRSFRYCGIRSGKDFPSNVLLVNFIKSNHIF